MTLEEKYQQLAQLRSEIAALEDEQRKTIDYPAAIKLQNTYGKCHRAAHPPASPAERWWIYRHVRVVRSDGTMLVHEIEIDSQGTLYVRVAVQRSWLDNAIWEPATKQEFADIVSRAQGMMDCMLTPTT